MPLPQEQLAAIEAAIVAQEASRAILGDGVVDIAIAALRTQAQKLRQALDDDAPASSVSPAEMLARLQSYIPRELATKMRALGRIEDERRPVTVLFADIAGFTALSERLDPEVVTALTNEALRALAEVVYRYEGYIDKFIGDAVMAVFGAPVAHEDDPERALRAALAMRDRLDEVSMRWIRRTGEPLSLHIGVHTGTVIAGNVGSDLRLSYTVMGDTVNTAARLRGVAAARHADRLLEIQLAPLSDAQSVEMAQDLLETCALPPLLVSLLRRRGEGNPLFVEELLRALVERGALVRRDDGWAATPAIETAAVPETLEGLLFARLDRLPERVKRVAQQAAVIGREFLHSVLRQLTEEPAQLDAHLARLMEEGLAYERTREPEVDYAFRHALIQEAAYRSLLAPRRRELHRRVGEAMERHFEGRIVEVQGIVGEHFLRGEAWERAARYLLAAGDADARIYAGSEARQRYMAALEALARLPDTEESRRARIDAIVKLDDVSFLVMDPTQALGQLSEAEGILAGLSDEGVASAEDRVRLLRVHLGMGRAHSLRGEQRAALGYVQPVLEAAEAMGDPLLAAGPRALSGIILVLSGRFPEGEERLSRSMGGLEQAGDWSTWIISACYLGVAMIIRGRYVEGIVELKNAEARAHELNNATGLSQAMSALGIAHLFGGNPRRAADTAVMALEGAAQSGDPVLACIAHRFLGWAQSRLGDHAAAVESLSRSREVERVFGGHPPFFADWLVAGDVEVAVNAGHAEEALSLSARARSFARGVGSAFSGGLSARAEGRALWLLGRLDEAEARFQESQQALVDCDARIELARTRVVWGALRRERGDLEGAARHLEAAAAQFAASGAGDELEQARRHLAAAGRISPH